MAEVYFDCEDKSPQQKEVPKMKTILTVLVAVALMLVIAVFAFAADTTKSNVTKDGKAQVATQVQTDTSACPYGIGTGERKLDGSGRGMGNPDRQMRCGGVNRGERKRDGSGMGMGNPDRQMRGGGRNRNGGVGNT